MIPLLLVSKDKKLVTKYIKDLKVGKLFIEVEPLDKEFSIGDIKNIIKETSIFNPQTRVYYFENFHNSSIPAQNSFLKLLEEPPTNVQFILTTDNKNNLLPTLISRVKIVKLQNALGATLKSPEISKLISSVVIDNKLLLSAFKITDKESAKKILLQLIRFFQTRLDTDKNSFLIIKEILRLNSLLENNNLNPQLTVDQGLIFIYKLYKIK